MEWKVVNGLNRDVERQHLNKILADIRTTVDGLSTTSSSPSTVTNTVVTRYAVANFLLSLTGAVEGSAQINGLGDVVLDTVLAEGVIEEAPIDNKNYWRWNGQWAQVPASVTAASSISGYGLVVRYEDFGNIFMATREITGVPGEISVANGDGISGNPELSLADTGVTPGTYGDSTHVVQITVDSKGRITAAADIALSGGGGSSNSYFPSGW